jgi:hypothetical protein
VFSSYLGIVEGLVLNPCLDHIGGGGHGDARHGAADGRDEVLKKERKKEMRERRKEGTSK